MKIMLKIAGVFAAAAILYYGLFLQEHDIHSLQDSQSNRVDDPELTRRINDDVLIRERNRLYDANTLVPEAAQLDDCST